MIYFANCVSILSSEISIFSLELQTKDAYQKWYAKFLTTIMTFAIVFLHRFGPLLKALWINVDVGLDFRQALEYREHAFEVNGTYYRWAISNNDPSTNYTETISSVYFLTSCVIFFFPPLIITLWYNVFGISDGDIFSEEFSFTKMILEQHNIKINTKRGGNWTVLLFPFIFVIDFILWCLQIYVFTPLSAMIIGFRVALTGDIDPELDVLFFLPLSISAEYLPFALLLEHLFEALPQLILSIFYLCNNYPFLLEFDTILGIPLPVSLISCIFSGGSLLMGIYSGSKAWYRVCTSNDDNKD